MGNEMSHKEVNLETINNGAAKELFQHEFEKVLRNIGDVSVNSDAPREIILKFKIKPTKDRQSATVSIKADSKLISVTEHQSSMFLSPQGAKAYVTDQRQMGLFEKSETKE